jgi:arylsulfatase A-like enzyme
LAAATEPFALFLHYYEPHGRWQPHREVVDFGESTGRQRHIDNYDSEIAFVDQYFGRTLDLLREHDLYEDSIIVLVSDHGEGFNEHGEYFHGVNLYEEVVRVPFIVRIPGEAHRQIDTPIALLDVAPTLLQRVGIDVPAEFEGIPLLAGTEPPADRALFSELLPYSNFREHHVALIEGSLKLIYNVTSRRYELYDLAADPGEEDNVYRESDQAERLQTRLVEWLEGG